MISRILGKLDGVTAANGWKSTFEGVGVGDSSSLSNGQLGLKALDLLLSDREHLKMLLSLIAQGVCIVVFVVDFEDGHVESFIKKPHPLLRDGVGRFSPEALTLRLELGSFGGD